MLTTLSTIKSRLAIPEADTTNDALLTSAIKAVSARFDKETNRTLARTVNFQQEFPADDTEVSVTCCPIESVTKFELKTTESEGWQEQSPIPGFLLRKSCIISLSSPLVFSLQPLALPVARATYIAGYVLPGTTPGPGQTALPDDLEQAAVEQVAYWFQKKDKLGLKTYWPSGAAYQQFADLDLLAPVAATLRQYKSRYVAARYAASGVVPSPWGEGRVRGNGPRPLVSRNLFAAVLELKRPRPRRPRFSGFWQQVSFWRNADLQSA